MLADLLIHDHAQAQKGQRGMKIKRIKDGGPADLLAPGDVILSIDGMPIGGEPLRGANWFARL